MSVSGDMSDGRKRRFLVEKIWIFDKIETRNRNMGIREMGTGDKI